jgi:hypothetical protein
MGFLKKLNINQEAFCQYYTGGGEYFGNGVWSYILAYKLKVPLISYSELNEFQKKKYDNARADAAQLLAKGNIRNRCDELLDALIKDEIVDRELAKVIMQNKELSAKVAAIKEYNQVKNRVKQDSSTPEIKIIIEDTRKMLDEYIKNGKLENKVRTAPEASETK